MKWGKIGPVVSDEDEFKDFTVVSIYTAQEQGQLTSGDRSLVFNKCFDTFILRLNISLLYFYCKIQH